MKKIVAPFLRTAYNYDTETASNETAIECLDKSLAQQHMVDDTDINKLVERFIVTGEMPQLVTPPLQGDFTQVMNYQDSLNLMIAAQKSFDALPAKIRNRFENDAGQFVEFCSQDANRDEVRQMGLYSPEAIKAYQDKQDAARAAQQALTRDAEAFRAMNASKADSSKPVS